MRNTPGFFVLVLVFVVMLMFVIVLVSMRVSMRVPVIVRVTVSKYAPVRVSFFAMLVVVPPVKHFQHRDVDKESECPNYEHFPAD